MTRPQVIRIGELQPGDRVRVPVHHPVSLRPVPLEVRVTSLPRPADCCAALLVDAVRMDTEERVEIHRLPWRSVELILGGAR